MKVAKRLPRKHLSEFLVEEGKVDAEAVRVENVGEIEEKAESDNAKSE